MGAVTLRKRTDANQLLDRNKTGQLRGLAIFMVIHGHIWFYVAAVRPSLYFSRDAVALFLLLLGYGLTWSFQRKIPTFKAYVNQKLDRKQRV